jgi:hypothetical protein
LTVPELTRSADIKLNERVSLRRALDGLRSSNRTLPPSGYTRLRPRAMHRVQKYVEVSSGRVGYALTVGALSKASHGSKWESDPSFNVADTILDNPEFVSVLRVVLRNGHVIVPSEGG